MEKNLQLYLHFIGNTDKTDPWNSEFSYYFSMVAKQILGYSPTLFSNVDVSAAKHFIYDSVVDLKEKDALIFILNSNPKESDFEFIASVLPEISSLQVFLVVRSYPKNIVIQESIKTLTTYNFFENNPYNFEITEFSPDGEGQIENDFWDKMTDLAYDVKLRCTGQTVSGAGSDFQKTVYLAEVSVDQVKNRERLLRELLLSGYRVLPEKPLPSSLKEFELAVNEAISQCCLSIHIMGEVYGDSPEGSDYSYVELQNRVFSKRRTTVKNEEETIQGIHRFIWFSPVFEPFEDKQNQYLKRLKKEILNSPDTELIHSTLYDLKEIVDQNFAHLLAGNTRKVSEDENKMLLITDEGDTGIIAQIEERLLLKEVDFVSLSKLKKDSFRLTSRMEEFRKYHNFLVVQTSPNDVWLNSISSILIRSKIVLNSFKDFAICILTPQLVEKVKNCAGLTIYTSTYGKETINQSLDSLISRLKP
jgi:hypothetical protein